MTDATDTLQHMLWQPIRNLRSRQLLGHEALARFTDRSPLEVFTASDHPDAQRALDQQCIAAALSQPPDHGLIFLNVTPATVRAGHWPPLSDTLKERVVWELPEAGGWQPTMIPPGYAVALDDVGIGFSELVRVTQVRWRFLKLDVSLVAGIGTQPTYRALIRDLVLRAQERHGAVIAEGIEAARDAATLIELGVTYGQGFLWGYPQRDPSFPAAAFEHRTASIP